MCSLVLLRRPGHAWPLLLAANRDELSSRPSRPPGRHWQDRADIVAGLDLTAGGTWLGLNDHGVVAAVLNRRGTLGPEAGKRSRGELVLEALDHAEAAAAARALRHVDPLAYRPFNLVVADVENAFWLRHAGDGPIRVTPIDTGLAMLTAFELDDPTAPRIRRFRPLFEAAPPPQPEQGDWSDWQLLLGAGAGPGRDPHEGMCITTENGYGTRCASLVALPADPRRPPVWLYADGRPDRAPFEPVSLA